MINNKKKLVAVELSVAGKLTNITGRCLGFITPKEYANIVKDIGVANKLMTVETKQLSEICELAKQGSMKDFRFVLAIKTVDDKNVIGKKLLISEEVAFASQICTDNELSLSADNTYITIKEA